MTGRSPAWSKAPHWGCGEREFKSRRPDNLTLPQNVTIRRYCAGMKERSAHGTAWSDERLPAAVASASSWRGVMRELGLSPSNGGTTQTIRRRSALLGLDTSHFRGNRSWSDTLLRKAVNEGRTWDEVLTTLGLRAQVGGERALVRAHALRLGLDATHLGRPTLHEADPCELQPDLAHLRRAAESLAAT